MLKIAADRWRVVWLGAVAACVLCSVPRSALAEEEPEVLIKQGIEMRKSGEDLKAHGYFQRAYDIARTPRAAAQLGLSDLSVHDNLGAEQHLTEALESTDPWVAKHRDLLGQSRDTARSGLGKVVVNDAPANTTVEVAGRSAVRLGADATIWVPPGSAVLRFATPDHEAVTVKVTVAAAATTTIEISLPATPAPNGGGGPVRETVPAAAPQPQPAPRPEPLAASPERSWQKTAAWVTGGVGVVFLAGGLTAQILYASKIDDFNNVTSAPNPTGKCDKSLNNDGGGQCSSLLDAANTRLKLAVIGFVGAGVALAGSLVLALTAPSTSAGSGSEKMAVCVPTEAGGISCALTVRF